MYRGTCGTPVLLTSLVKDQTGVNVFEFNGGALTPRKAEVYIRKAGGIPVYGAIQIVPEDGTTLTWYGTIGVDATRWEVESWLRFVKSVGPEKCEITMVKKQGELMSRYFLPKEMVKRTAFNLPVITE